LAGDRVAFALWGLDRRAGERACEQRFQRGAGFLRVPVEETAELGQTAAGFLFEAAGLEVDGAWCRDQGGEAGLDVVEGLHDQLLPEVRASTRPSRACRRAVKGLALR
jgi:hypothetical protein